MENCKCFNKLNMLKNRSVWKRQFLKLNNYYFSLNRLKRSAKIAEFLKSLDKTLPSWAEIVPESYVNHDLETHDGQKVVNTVFAPLLWFGPDCTPPSQTAIVKPPDAVPPQKEEIAISCEFKFFSEGNVFSLF